MTEVKISVDLLNAVLAYLDKRPYGEVVGLIQAIHAAVTPQVQAVQQKTEG
jgi:hypothetical protein